MQAKTTLELNQKDVAWEAKIRFLETYTARHSSSINRIELQLRGFSRSRIDHKVSDCQRGH